MMNVGFLKQVNGEILVTQFEIRLNYAVIVLCQRFWVVSNAYKRVFFYIMGGGSPLKIN